MMQNRHELVCSLDNYNIFVYRNPNTNKLALKVVNNSTGFCDFPVLCDKWVTWDRLPSRKIMRLVRSIYNNRSKRCLGIDSFESVL